MNELALYIVSAMVQSEKLNHYRYYMRLFKMRTRTEAIVGADGGVYARLLPLDPWDCSPHRSGQTENWMCNEGEQRQAGAPEDSWYLRLFLCVQP